MSKKWLDVLKSLNSTYDNIKSGLSSKNVQNAIDELNNNTNKLEEDVDEKLDSKSNVFYQTNAPVEYEYGDIWIKSLEDRDIYMGGDVVDEFIFVMRTTADNETITLPATGTNNFEIDWGDGTIETITTVSPTHEYLVAGDYTITISGQCSRWYFNNTAEADKLIAVNNLGVVGWGTLYDSFEGCANLNGFNCGSNDITAVTGLANMFRYCSSLTSLDLKDMETSSVTNMANMLANMTGITTVAPDVSNFDTTNVTTISGIFSSNTSMSATPDVSGWVLTNCEIFSNVFSSCNSMATPPDVSNWDTSSATTMSQLFYNTLSLTVAPNLSNFDTSNVTNMYRMMWGFNNVLIPPDLSSFDTSNVENLESCMRQWVTIGAMDIPIDTWNIESCTNMTNMLLGSTLTTACYDRTLIAWSQQTVQPDVVAHFGNSKYSTASAAARDILTINNNWTITDGGPA